MKEAIEFIKINKNSKLEAFTEESRLGVKLLRITARTQEKTVSEVFLNLSDDEIKEIKSKI